MVHLVLLCFSILLYQTKGVVAGDERQVFVVADVCQERKQLLRIREAIAPEHCFDLLHRLGPLSGWLSRATEISKNQDCLVGCSSVFVTNAKSVLVPGPVEFRVLFRDSCSILRRIRAQVRKRLSDW